MLYIKLQRCATGKVKNRRKKKKKNLSKILVGCLTLNKQNYDQQILLMPEAIFTIHIVISTA
jgi:hypothetical protein